MQQLTKDFNLSEFKCKDGNIVPYYYLSNVMYLATQLQKMHDLFNLDFLRINSGYRTQSHNKNVGGSKNSFHLFAMAADISQQNINVKTFYLLIKEAIKLCIIPDGEVLLYDTFVHYAPQFDVKHFSTNEDMIKNILKKNPTFSKKCKTHDYTPF